MNELTVHSEASSSPSTLKNKTKHRNPSGWTTPSWLPDEIIPFCVFLKVAGGGCLERVLSTRWKTVHTCTLVKGPHDGFLRGFSSKEKLSLNISLLFLIRPFFFFF